MFMKIMKLKFNNEIKPIPIILFNSISFGWFVFHSLTSDNDWIWLLFREGKVL